MKGVKCDIGWNVLVEMWLGETWLGELLPHQIDTGRGGYENGEREGGGGRHVFVLPLFGGTQNCIKYKKFKILGWKISLITRTISGLIDLSFPLKQG